jgi:hypothetical protein
MGLLDVHAPGIQSSFNFDLRNPAPPEPPASFNLWAFGSSGFGSLRIAGYQTAANFFDLTAGLSVADRSSVSSMNSTAEEKAALTSRYDADIAANRSQAAAMRQRAAELAPDPLSAHRSEQVISSLGSGLVRAVGAVSTMGPAAGGVIFGSAEGDNAYAEAREAGIDPKTALKVAGTTGVFSGVTAALPGVGSTIPRTLGLVGVTGPGAYMANEAISRRILQQANYPEQAAMHDPTDPLGLSLSIAIPGVIGGFHARALAKKPSIAEVALSQESGGRRLGADGQLLTSAKGAQGEMQVMPDTQANPGFGVRPAALGPDGKPTPDEIARVGVDYIAAMQQRYGGDAAKTLAAYNAGPGTLDAAIAAHGDDWLSHMPEETQKYVASGVKKLGDGNVAHAAQDPDVVDAARVHLAQRAVTEHLPDHPEAFAELQRATDAVSRGPVAEAMPDPARVDLEGQLRTIEAQRAAALTESSGLAEPGAIRQARQELKVHESQAPDTSDAAVQVRAYEIQALSRNGLLKTAQKQAQDEIAQLRADHEATTQRLQSIIEGDARAQRAIQSLAELDRQHAEISDKLQSLPLTSVRPAELRPTAAAARDALMSRDSVTIKAPKPEPVPQDMFVPRPQQVEPTGEAGARPKGEAARAPAAAPAGEGAKPEPPSLEAQRADAVIAENSELKVRLAESGEVMTAGEAMERARSEAQHDLGERDLFRAAVQCALTFGV